MNERIKELSEQYASENRPGSFVKYDPEWFVFYNKKFAELIVRECTDIADNQEDYLTAKIIKQHFGVEE